MAETAAEGAAADDFGFALGVALAGVVALEVVFARALGLEPLASGFAPDGAELGQPSRKLTLPIKTRSHVRGMDPGGGEPMRFGF